MKAFIENPNLLIKEFNEVASRIQKKTFITIGIEIQKEEIEAQRDLANEQTKPT